MTPPQAIAMQPDVQLHLGDCLEILPTLEDGIVDAVSCGYCDGDTTRHSEYTCKTCGRIICEECGIRWGWCKHHVPECNHTEIFIEYYPDSEPREMLGSCQHNMSCPICGYGWGTSPDPCEKLYKKRKEEKYDK